MDTAFDVDRIRSRFPALSLTDHGRRRVYFDNPAGTQVPDTVIDGVRHALVQCNANTNGRFPTSEQITELSRQAHLGMADLLNARSEREVVFGPNMTSLTFMVTRAIAHLFEEGDEIILTRMEHDANVTPWTIMAEERGLVIRRLDFDPATCRFDLAQLDALMGERTRFAAINYASNVLGTVNDVGEICRRVRAAGGITYVDAVQYTPHLPVDVQALGCDFLVCSAYKFFGPHQGVLWGREEMLERLRPYKLRASPSTLPHRLETGTQSFEGQAGTLGALAYLEWIGTTMGTRFLAQFPHMAGRRRALHAAMMAIGAYEQRLGGRLIAGLAGIPGVVIHGITDPALYAHRVPTVSVSVAGVKPEWMAAELGNRGVFVWHGSAYALDVIERLGLADQGGVVRFGPTHYNTIEEVDYAVACLAEILAHAPRGGASASSD